ncbi:conserved hypothetical protein [Gloeothece citriformis PCC 7424]|uniref:Flavin reductase like domain-containing protein n=1 Tax=Gloeothece citriformis (strain PCC 7424) TaxID=65393 RepID=B7KIG7_GLOC7|nr:flavin reductase [Gloeothece citriformis]ACK69373.1 conserved hypothetical protein [Gloeothece citriformis PCC 7424]
MSQSNPQELLHLDLEHPIWERFFSVAPLVIVGTKEAEGGYDLAPKHLAMPLGWDNYFGFICTPRHRTYQNIQREQVFTVSFPTPEQIIYTSLTAAPRCDNDQKLSLEVIPVEKALRIEGIFLKDAYLVLECELDRIIDHFGENSLIAGKIVAAHLQKQALREPDIDDHDIIDQLPLLAYLSPGRFATIKHTQGFPFHQGFKR